MQPGPLALLALAAGPSLQLASWRVQVRTRDAGWVDACWSGSVGALAVLHAGLAEGWAPRRALVALLAGLWSLRLTTHLVRRLRSESAEDGRYAALRTRWGARFERRMLALSLAQGVLAAGLSLAMLVPSAAAQVGWRANDALAVLVWAVSLAGESLADRQLRAWRRDPAHRGRTCRAGLWARSRHPNYFFGWLHWWTWPLLSLGLPWGAAVWLAPLALLLLLLFVTGIPPAEEQALRSRGDDYRAYQRTTNAFFPGPRRTEPLRAMTR